MVAFIPDMHSSNDDTSTELATINNSSSSPSCHRGELCLSLSSFEATHCLLDATAVPLPPLDERRKRQRQRRAVHFLVDDLDRDLVEVVEYEVPSQDVWSDLYWTHEEKRSFTDAARRHVTKVTSLYPDRIERLEAAFCSCGKAVADPDSGNDDDSCKRDMRTIVQWAQSSERGLEDSVTAVFWHERRAYIQDVIAYCCAQTLDGYTNANASGESLRRYSEDYTRCSREFAYKMAIADELIR